MPRRHPLLISAVALLCTILALPTEASEADGPWAQLMSATPKASDPRQYPIGIYAIDGLWSLSPETYVRVAPGLHRIIVMDTSSNGPGLVTQVELQINAKPCMAYHLLGDYPRGTSDPDWRPIVVTEHPIKRGLKKFGIPLSDPAIPTPSP